MEWNKKGMIRQAIDLLVHSLAYKVDDYQITSNIEYAIQWRTDAMIQDK